MGSYTGNANHRITNAWAKQLGVWRNLIASGRSSIAIGLGRSILARPEVRSSTDGTCNIGCQATENCQRCGAVHCGKRNRQENRSIEPSFPSPPEADRSRALKTPPIDRVVVEKGNDPVIARQTQRRCQLGTGFTGAIDGNTHLLCCVGRRLQNIPQSKRTAPVNPVSSNHNRIQLLRGGIGNRSITQSQQQHQQAIATKRR